MRSRLSICGGPAPSYSEPVTQPTRASYFFVGVLLLLVGWLQLATPLITVMAAYFALSTLSLGGRKWLGLALFILLLTGVFVGAWLFSKHAYVTLPQIAQSTIPKAIEYAEQRGIELPFTDYVSLKKMALEQVKEKIANVGHYARAATIEVVFVIIGIIVAVSLFLSQKLDLGEEPEAVHDNLYAAIGLEVAARFRTFYQSFSAVMGAQMIISAINTLATSVFLGWNHYPYMAVIIVFTFLFGLLPIIGNLLSNTLIVGVGLTVSPYTAFAALVFLVVLHKAEYFLNSKIIGHRIRNPMWLTLLALILGEKLMGVPGMILAPVVLHFIKIEASRNKVSVLGGAS